jgi:hypothetical protein
VIRHLIKTRPALPTADNPWVFGCLRSIKAANSSLISTPDETV